jgi:hypothetical protein
MDHAPHSPDLALNDFWLFAEMKFALKGQRRILKTSKKCDESTESHSAT